MRIGLVVPYLAVAGAITVLAFAHPSAGTPAFELTDQPGGDTPMMTVAKGGNTGNGPRTTTPNNGPASPPKKPAFYGTEHGSSGSGSTHRVRYPREQKKDYCFTCPGLN